jgi:hypothetical protein
MSCIRKCRARSASWKKFSQNVTFLTNYLILSPPRNQFQSKYFSQLASGISQSDLSLVYAKMAIGNAGPVEMSIFLQRKCFKKIFRKKNNNDEFNNRKKSPNTNLIRANNYHIN